MNHKGVCHVGSNVKMLLLQGPGQWLLSLYLVGVACAQ